MSDNNNGGFPSMTALLGMLAVAGYQNRDKIAEWFSNRAPAPQQGSMPSAGQAGGLGGLLGGLLGAGGAGAVLNSGLGELVERFNQAGQGEKANSWVAHGPNQQVAPSELEQALGADTLDKISQHTGLSREELLGRLANVLPEAVDRYTPEGRLARS